MDNKSTTKRMIGAVVLVLIAALLLAWLLKGKSRGIEEKNLIADQTQETSPILGFPGVNKDGQAVNEQGQIVAADGTTPPEGVSQEMAATQDGASQDGATPQEVVIGNPDEAAQSQAQNALNGQAQDGTTAAGTVTAAVGEVVNAGKGVVQELATNVQPDTTGFQVRDPNGEVRQVVEDGKTADGVGSMGADVTTAAKPADPAAQRQTAAATDEGAGTAKTTSGKKTATASAPASTATASAASSSKSSNTKEGQQVAVSGGELKPAKIANPKLVNERPVPAPAAQARTSSGSSSSSNKTTVAASSSKAAAPAAATATASAAKKDGYVIQVLATADKGKADGVKRSIAVDGYPAFVAQARVDGKTVYRVRVGSYPGKNDAAAVQARMKVRYGENQYVQNSFVTQN